MIIITADLHLTDNPRDAYRHEFMKKLATIVREKKADGVVIIGDLTEEKDRHSAWLTNKVVDHMNALGVPLLFIRGNHDGVTADESFFAFLDRIPNMTWVDRPMTMESVGGLWYSKLGKKKGLVLPHTRDYKEDWKKFRLEDYRVIFAHNTFKGAHGGFGRELDGIPVEVMPEDAMVISGDVHIPQRLGPVRYVGAPYTVDFGDDYDARLFCLYDDMTLTSLRVSGNPQKRLVEFKSLSDLRKRGNLNKGDIVKVKMHCEDYAKWGELREAVYEWGKREEYVVHTVIPIIENDKGDPIDEVDAEKWSVPDDEILSEYASRHGVDDKTLAEGVKIIEEE